MSACRAIIARSSRNTTASSWETGDAADANFAAWCAGQTGYPLVDAAMRQINQSGYMHNRLRMVVASFLTKDLGIDWRRGEAYFEALLNDFELSIEQWRVAVGGVERLRCAAVFPHLQSGDAVARNSIRRASSSAITCRKSRRCRISDIHAPWRAKPDALKAAKISLGADYPLPIVDHDAARKRTLARYDVVRKPARKSAPPEDD